ncbi:MFS transporter [Collimonas arenae]|uniref:MFS transporter n=1 Tax=Collimonas arenae TaxID=279058 RepID=UPI000570BCD0|nr:MFS transporter [Collimonas arenae]
MAISRVFLTPLIVACALFMENMDSTVIATSLPMMAHDMGESPIALKLAMTSYLVSLAVFIPISGWMADRFGARTVFRSAIGVFMLGSILCGMSNTLAEFVAARFLQGIGGAMMVPVGRLVILRTTSKAELVRALSYLTIPALLGPVIGPPLGGFITTYFHWRWIFFINVPISILGIYLATRYIENLRSDDTVPLDFVGFLLSAVGCSTLMFGLASAGRHLVAGDVSLVCVIAGSVSLLAYVWHAFRTPYPLINLRLLKIPTLRMNVYGGSLFRIGVGALPFLLPLLFQLGFGLTPFQSGLLTCASAAGAIFVKTMTTKVLRRFGFRSVLVYNTLLGALSMAAFGVLKADTSHIVIILMLLLGGCVRSMQFTSLNAIAYAEIDQQQMSQATSLTSVAQQLAIGLGVTVGGYALQMSNQLQGHATIVSADFWPAFLLIALIAMASLPFALKLQPDAGAEMSGRRAG